MNEGDSDFGVGVDGIIGDVSDVVIVRSESFEDVVVVVEVEGDGVSHDFFLFDYRSTLPNR